MTAHPAFRLKLENLRFHVLVLPGLTASCLQRGRPLGTPGRSTGVDGARGSFLVLPGFTRGRWPTGWAANQGWPVGCFCQPVAGRRQGRQRRQWRERSGRQQRPPLELRPISLAAIVLPNIFEPDRHVPYRSLPARQRRRVFSLRGRRGSGRFSSGRRLVGSRMRSWPRMASPSTPSQLARVVA